MPAPVEITGLTAETIKAAGIYWADRKAASTLVGYPAPSSGIVFPYFGPGCEGYNRLRWDVPPLDDKGKEQRYSSPKGSSNHLYIPPTLAPEILTDPRIPLAITEGEKKALKAIQEGLHCIATAGIWAWRGKDGPIPDLARIYWRGRQVVLIYDSDITPDHKGYPAYQQLGLELQRLGAHVTIVTLPEVADGA